MKVLESLYRSPMGRVMSLVARALCWHTRPKMIYGWVDRESGAFRKYTRVSSSAVIMSPERLAIGDRVWIWHYSIVDATEGIRVGEGCQVSAWVGIFTHGSESSIRLLGKQFVDIASKDRLGYRRGSISIGEYTMIASGSLILPGVTIGKGCLIASGTTVNRDVADYAIVAGPTARQIGSTIDSDSKHFKEMDFSETYYDKQALMLIRKKLGIES